MKFVAGIDVGGTNVKAVLVDASLAPLASRSMPTERELGSEAILSNIVGMLAGMIADAGLSENDLAAIGMGVPGLVDRMAKTAVKLGSLYWFDVPIAAPFSDRFSVPVVLDNDGNINALGEQRLGGGQGCKDLLLVTLGTGIGSGIIADGRLIRGVSGLAGEIGHMIIETDGELCRCGRRGCFQCYCSEVGISGYARKQMELHPESVLWRLTGGEPSAFTPEMMDKGFDDGDAASEAVLARTSRYLGVALSSLVSIFNPECILLGGGISRSGERLLGPAREMVREALTHPSQMCTIAQAKLGIEAGTYGACILAWEHVGGA